MSFSAVGTVIKPTVSTSTFTLVPSSVGDFIVIGVLAGFPSGSTTGWATALTSAGGDVTWSVLVSPTTFSVNKGVETVFIGKVVTATSHTVTITFNTGTPAVRVAGQEFSNTLGFAAVTLDASGTVDLASSGHYAAVTPTRASDLYWGYCWDTGTVANGSTSGYVYQADASGNGMAYNLSCANSTQTPNTGNTDGLTGLGVMLYEAATSPALADVAGAKDAVTLSAAVPQGDVAGAADKLVPNAAVPLADVAGAAEALSVSVPVALADVAGAADRLSVGVSVPLADKAGVIDADANITPTPTDFAAASDSIVVAAGGPPTLGGTLPGGGGSQVNPPGYQGGPSGAGSVVPSALGNAWEIYAYSGLDYTTLLAVIPASMLLSFQFARQLDDLGSGTVVLSQDDPWWAQVTLPGGLPAETLLDEECMWQFRKDGVPRFEFLGETVTEQLVDPSEQRQVTITGPGTIAALKWAMIAPQGFPDIVLKLDGILDSFDEVDANGNGVVDTNIWTTVSPAGHVYITPIANIYTYPGGVGYNLGTLFPSGSLTIEASPSTTYLGASPYDATDTLISAQVTPIGVSSTTTDATTPATYGTGLNGSELTQFYIQSNFDSANYALFGLSGSAFYVQAGSGAVSTKILPAYDSTAHAYWMITEQAGSGGGSGTFYFWTSPDGQTWTQQWTYVHEWDASDVTFFVTATYSADNTQSVVITNLNSNVTTPSYQGSLYLGEPLMGVWLDQFSKAQARGTVPFVTSLVTAARDTYGRPWADVQNVQAVNGTDLYSFLQSATSVVNADYVMDPGFQLRVGQPATGEVALGVDRSGYLVLREGYDTASKQRVRARNAIQTLIAGENADGHEISAFSPAFIAEWGQREGWFQAAVQVDPTSMAYASAAALAQNETEVLSWTFNLVPNLPGKTVFDNFDVGDWLGLERPDFSAVDPVRVMGIAVQVDSAGAETHELTFVSYIQWLAEQLTYISNKLGGAFVNSLGTSPVAPSKYGTGQVPTYFTPAATLAGLADVAGNSAGSTMSTAPLVYNPATGQYQHAGTTDPVTGLAVPVTVATPGGSVTVSGITVTVNNGAGSTVVGLQGDGTVTSVDSGGAAPGVPDVPVVAGIVQGLVVAWDGLLSGVLPLSNFQYVQVHVGTSSGFTPSGATLQGTLAVGGVLTVSGLTAGVTYYAKLVAVSTAGVASGATTGIAGTAAGVPTSLLTGQLPASLIGNSAGNALNPNPFFNGGDLTGWFVTNGTVSSGAPPSGAPGGAQYAAEISSTSANCLLSGSPDPFPVTPGQPYVMTAWVYNPGGSSVSVAIGFNWTSGTTTVSVSPGTWVPLTTVQTCPGGVTSAYQVIGPTASGHTVWVLGAVAAGQVPGQLIAANSVAAQQIAANTITAAQIAANTITAAQIAANTITAGQIAASTITAAQIAAATITTSLLAANAVTAAKIAANTITGAQIAASVSLTSPVIAGGTITGATLIADGSSGEFLVYAGTPASGNLVLSVSAVAGSDGLGNSYGAGLEIISSGGSRLQLFDSGTAAVMTGRSGAASEASPATLSMSVFNAGLANENMQMQLRGPESTSDSGAVSIILTSSAADGSSLYGGTLEVGSSSAAGWGSGTLGTQLSITHQLLIGGATGGSQVEMSGDIHVGGNIIIGSGAFPVATPSTAGSPAAQGTWSTGQQSWAASVTTIVNNIRAQLLTAGIFM